VIYPAFVKEENLTFLKSWYQRTMKSQYHICNPRYFEDRDQEDCGSRPARKKLLRPFPPSVEQARHGDSWLKF
jgi:hypothetical protein